MSAMTKFYFRPGDREWIDTTVHISPDTRSAIHGIVRDAGENPVADALVMLFSGGRETLRPVGQMFTDQSGQFFFGPLESGQLYLVQIYKNAGILRELEIHTGPSATGPAPVAPSAGPSAGGSPEKPKA